MAADAHNVTGIQAGRLPGGQLPIRMEFDDWWFSKDLDHINQRTLFIRAMINWQAKGLAKGQPDDLSYFSIAGIHGLPKVKWPTKGGEGSGFYCAHHMKTFATWHTPYMALYEQQLYWEMSNLIPSTFISSQQAEYQKAADSWRLPYWDWAMKKPTWAPNLPEEQQYAQPHRGPNVPFAFTQQQVEIRAGKDSTLPAIKVRNPLFQFALNEGTQFGDYGVSSSQRPWVAKCRVTSRWPSTTNEKDKTFTSDYVNGQNQDYTKVTSQLQGSVEDDDYFANSLPEAVLRLINTRNGSEPAMPYETFVTNAWNGGGPQDYPSLEAIHDNLHGFTGGAGYMGSPATSAFDPIFWLHHCNVDRLLAIWQELYPAAYKRWLDSDPKNKDSEGPNAELVPFKNDQGAFFTSATTSYKHQQMNYTYPELQRWNFKTDQEYFDSIYKTFERLYSYSPKASLLLKKNAVVAKKQMAAMTPKNLEVENFPPQLVEKFPTADDGSTSKFGKPPTLEWDNEDYLLNVVYEPFALEGQAYAVVIYLGDIPTNVQNDFGMVDFAQEKTAISTVFNFSSTAEGRGIDETGCANCKRQESERILASGQVILTDYLIERIVQGRAYQGLTLTSLDQAEVLPYLKKNLHYVVQTRFGETIQNTDQRMERLKFSVAHGPAVHNSDPAQLSRYGPYTPIWDFPTTQPAQEL